MLNKGLSFLLLFILLLGLVGSAQPAQAAPSQQSPDLRPIIDDYRQRIQKVMAEQNIPGLAIALVDDQQVLWSEGFGYTDTDRRTPVSTSTLFSIQSMSKSFTATAVMLAVQDGLVELDAPITTYLPDFTVSSIFEDHPERKMTLRMLLAHTAGFTHEAPIGSNYDLPTHTFEEHIASISDTWLLFPVGTRYSYSNLGIDLAGYILQVRSGMPFTEYVREKIYRPLGMAGSAFATPEIRSVPGRAIGHVGFPIRPVAPFLLLPAGGIYTSADDLARYVMFHINRGALDGATILRSDLAEEMYTPPFAPSAKAEYALGLGAGRRNGSRILCHGGGGFGFLSQMYWYPELKLGGLLLTNSSTHTIQSSLLESLLDEIIRKNPQVYQPRGAASLGVINTAQVQDPAVLSDAGLAKLIRDQALDEPGAKARRSTYAGEYIHLNWGFPTESFQLRERNGELYKGFDLLTEVKPGLFFDPQGEVYDLRGPRLNFRNIPLEKVNPGALTAQYVFLGLAGLLFFSALLFWPVRALVRRARRLASPGLGRKMTVAAWLSALLSLAGLLPLALVALLPQLLSTTWPAPFIDFQPWFNTLLLLPYLGLALAAALIALVALDRRGPQREKVLRIYLLVVAVAALMYHGIILG